MNIISTIYFKIESSAYRFIPFSDSTKMIFMNTITPLKKKQNIHFIKTAVRTAK